MRLFLATAVAVLSLHSQTFTAMPPLQSKMGTNDCASPSPGWRVFICRKNTTANAIRLFVGLGGKAETHEGWITWTRTDGDWVRVPSKYRYTQEIWIRGEGVPDGHEVHMCIFYDERSTQKMTFNHGEEHEVSWNDNDDCKCGDLQPRR
jgi:predicted small integral membrane protein